MTTRLLPLIALALVVPAAAGCTLPPPSARPALPASQPGPAPADLAAESRASHAAVTDARSRGSSFATAAANTTSSQCGALDQRPCLVWEAIPSCHAGLAENLLAHRCVSPGAEGALASNARAVATDLRDLLAALGGYITCFDAALIKRALETSNAAYAAELQRSSCVQRMGAMAHARGYRTLTVGISGGGAFVLGASIDTGFAFATDGRSPPTLYQTKAISVGFQAGGGVAINLGLSRGRNAVDPAGSDAQGFSFEGGAGAGAGVAIWYDYDGNLDGVSVSAIAGASGKAGAYNRVNTAYYDPNGNNPVFCGAAGKRACKVWERIPSCNPGLYEDLLKGVCKKPAPPKRLACGARNQRPCKLWERVPSCDRGLVEDFFAGKCR